MVSKNQHKTSQLQPRQALTFPPSTTFTTAAASVRAVLDPVAGPAAAKALIAAHLRLRLKLVKKKTNAVLKIRTSYKLENKHNRQTGLISSAFS